MVVVEVVVVVVVVDVVVRLKTFSLMKFRSSPTAFVTKH